MSDHLPDTRLLAHKDTALAVVSRASVEQIEAFRKRAGWTFPWVSSSVEGNTFNYDFHATTDESIAPIQVNFKDKSELEAKGLEWKFEKGEGPPGLSVFLREQDEIFHSYSIYRRGIDHLLTTFSLLDLTPLGRQGAAPGFKYHDMYE